MHATVGAQCAGLSWALRLGKHCGETPKAVMIKAAIFNSVHVTIQDSTCTPLILSDPATGSRFQFAGIDRQPPCLKRQNRLYTDILNRDGDPLRLDNIEKCQQRETRVQSHMRNQTTNIRLHLGVGVGCAT